MTGPPPVSPPRWTPANLLTAFRLFIAAPGMLLCAACGWRAAFIGLMLAAFLSDLLDGTLARLAGQQGGFGARLDSWADVAAYASIGLSVMWLWPERVAREWAAFSALAISIAAPAAVGWLRFGRFTSYHTWSVKLAVVTSATGVTLLTLADHGALLRAGAVLGVLAAAEEIALSCVLDAPRDDVRGLWALRRSGAEPPRPDT